MLKFSEATSTPIQLAFSTDAGEQSFCVQHQWKNRFHHGWRVNQGWVTAEYNMLPGSTSPRKRRDRGGKIDGRTTEIQRLIGRSLRSIIDLKQLGERSITVDCDVLQADGGTRTASITGGFIALSDAISQILPHSEVATAPYVIRSPRLVLG